MVEWVIKYWLQIGFGIIVTGGTLFFKKFSAKMKKNKETTEMMRVGLRVLLELSLNELYHKYRMRGMILKEELELYTHLYQAYMALGTDMSMIPQFEYIKTLRVVQRDGEAYW